VGTAAALATLDPAFLETDKTARELLAPLWSHEAMETKEAKDVLSLIEEARPHLKRWRDSDFREKLGWFMPYGN